MKSQVLDSFGYPDVPLEILMRELSVQRGEGGSLLYQALFSFQDVRQRVANWGGLTHEQIQLFQPGATEDLGLWFVENDRGMAGGVIYNADIIRRRDRSLVARALSRLDGVRARCSPRLRWES